MGHPSRSMEDSGAECDLMNCGDQQISEGGNINMLCRDCTCDTLVKKVVAICPCLKNLPENKVRSFGLIQLADDTTVHTLFIENQAFCWVVISDHAYKDL